MKNLSKKNLEKINKIDLELEELNKQLGPDSDYLLHESISHEIRYKLDERREVIGTSYIYKGIVIDLIVVATCLAIGFVFCKYTTWLLVPFIISSVFALDSIERLCSDKYRPTE